jgi:uncharacterized membrane protein YczE
MFEAGFFISFLLLYYSVLVERKPNGLGFFEAFMDVWIVAFAYDELSGLIDAGMLFYQMDFWSLWNLGIIGVGFAFMITSKSVRFPCHRICLAVVMNDPPVKNLGADGKYYRSHRSSQG